jgi:hypothetical protein
VRLRGRIIVYVKHARRPSNGRGGRHAGENVISAAPDFFTRAGTAPEDAETA